MTEKPTAKSAEPESPPHGPEGNPPPATAKRPRRKKILVPVVLAVIGLALLVAGFLMVTGLSPRVGRLLPRRPARRAGESQMTEKPTAKSAEPESPPHGPEGNPPPATAKRPRRKKILVPVVLAVIGLALLVAGFLMYPHRAEAPTPTSASLVINGVGSHVNARYVDSHMVLIEYAVSQFHPDVAGLAITVVLDGDSAPHGAKVAIQLSQPGGLTVLRCFPGCHPASPAYEASALARFIHTTATAYFVLKAHSYGVAANGATAAVAFPEVDFGGTQQASMNLSFGSIPAANTYDWSSYPPLQVSNSYTLWAEPVAPGPLRLFPRPGRVTNGRVVTGINHDAQAHDSTLTLVVGVLFGIAGGALVAAVQEALHD